MNNYCPTCGQARHAGVNGEDLRTARRLKGWTQADLGARLGVQKGIVSQWENGNAQIHEKHHAKIKRILR